MLLKIEFEKKRFVLSQIGTVLARLVPTETRFWLCFPCVFRKSKNPNTKIIVFSGRVKIRILQIIENSKPGDANFMDAPALLAGSAPAKPNHNKTGFTALVYKAVVKADDEQWERAAAAVLAERGNESRHLCPYPLNHMHHVMCAGRGIPKGCTVGKVLKALCKSDSDLRDLWKVPATFRYARA